MPDPTVTMIRPASTPAGSTTTLMVLGSGFTRESKIYFDGGPRDTVYVGPEQLISFALDPAWFAAPRTILVGVVNGLGGTPSNLVPLEVTAPAAPAPPAEPPPQPPVNSTPPPAPPVVQPPPPAPVPPPAPTPAPPPSPPDAGADQPARSPAPWIVGGLSESEASIVAQLARIGTTLEYISSKLEELIAGRGPTVA